jgi:hypothetical protein
MLVYISYSHSDLKLFKSLRDRCEARGFTIVSREKSLELREALSEKGRQRITMANVAVILLTSNGRSSFRVFQEAEFITAAGKDHFILQGFGNKIEAVSKSSESSSAAVRTDHYISSLKVLEKILKDFSMQLKPEEFNFIYHTDIVY